MIMCIKTSQKDVVKAIQSFGEFGMRPEGMEIDVEERIFYKQFNIDYEIKDAAQGVKVINTLKLNLYFDPVRRTHELMELEITLLFQKAALDKLIEEKSIIGTDNTIKRDYSYYKITLDSDTKTIKSFELNEKKVAKARRLSGFFSIMSNKVNFCAMKTLHTYHLRDEQEKYFQQMKTQMKADRQRNWSEEGKTGRLLILFVGLILSSWVRYVWKSSRLKNLFNSSLDVLDEMRPIRCIEQSNQSKITPFVGAQLDICEAFGFGIPENSAPLNIVLQKTKRKRGRPPKKRTT
jgi:hypothetical protein